MNIPLVCDVLGGCPSCRHETDHREKVQRVLVLLEAFSAKVAGCQNGDFPQCCPLPDAKTEANECWRSLGSRQANA